MGDVMAVRTELVLEQLVDRMLAAVQGRDEERLADEVRRRIETGAARFLPSEPGLAVAVASAGYRARIVEAELMAPAREPFAEAAAPFALAEPERFAAELAEAEPAGRPEPGDPRAASWRVPGPGGHVRHYLALRTAGTLHAARTPAAAGPADAAGLKRCWMYGFFLRCADEAR